MIKTPSPSLFLLGFTLALALGSGFAAHRLAGTLVEDPGTEPAPAPRTAAPVERVSDSLPDLIADPAGLPDQTLAAWNDANYLDAGLAFYRWLETADAEAIFQYEASKTTAQGLSVSRIARLMNTLANPDLLEAAREGIAQGASYIAEPLERLKMLDQLAIPMKRSPQSPDIYHRALSERPDDTIDWLLTLDPSERQAALRSIFSSTLSGNTDTKGWHDLYLRLPREELPSVLRLDLYFGRNSDAETVLSWFEETIARNHFVPGDDEASEKALFFRNAQGYGSQLALQNVDSALAQARQIEDDKLRNALLLGIGTATATFDPESARALLPELEGTDQTALETAIFEQEFKALPLDEALGALAAIPDSDRRNQLASSLVFENSISPDRRAAVVDERPALFRSSLGLVIQWANQDPRTAAEWIAQYADHPVYPRNVERLVEAWARHDIVEAAHWVLAQEPGAARDKSIAAISEQVVERDPRRALEWAAAISDPQERLEHLKDAAVSLDRYATQADEAVEALAGLSLTESERTELLQHLEEAP